ncbi:LysM peptidoglycan-binding domain-containing protein [Paenibacillus sp. FJAT-26967]|uniref:LysM peptidoglycan-binding domain-containing protein n=1 Tax=Paenibacillus sp. FJAT-26967 TaxID=1729690 RepID=UPI000837F945|nr:LysM peptidoglycan-binding domain-containing protein [Paenibacillus sp. FJAT-26967]
MTEKQNGLRFDIYERVHLADEAADIRDLEDVELVPRIQVITQQEQALLKGSLLLNGSYLDDEETKRTLEHYIPVEITLPLNRVQRIEDILVEIETFDVDVLSARSINVTGVLSLHGVETALGGGVWAQEEEVLFVHETADRADEEPVQQIIHTQYTGDSQPFRQQQQFQSGAAYQEQQRQQDTGNRQQEQSRNPSESAAYSDGPAGDSYLSTYGNNPYASLEADNPWLREARSERQEPRAEPTDFNPWEVQEPNRHTSADERVSSSFSDSDSRFGELTLSQVASDQKPGIQESAGPDLSEEDGGERIPESSPVADTESSAESKIHGQPELKPAGEFLQQDVQKNETQGAEEKRENDLAFEEQLYTEVEQAEASAEPAAEEEPKELKVAFGSRRPGDDASGHQSGIHSLYSGSAASDRTDRKEREAEIPVTEEFKADALEWKKLFINGEQEVQKFRKVTMCIVQKEETIETIARKYEVNARELQLYNRLEEQDVNAGQILYIPRSKTSGE